MNPDIGFQRATPRPRVELKTKTKKHARLQPEQDRSARLSHTFELTRFRNAASPRGGQAAMKDAVIGGERGVLLLTFSLDEESTVLDLRKMPIEFIQRLFPRKRKGWMSMSDCLKRHDRELKRD